MILAFWISGNSDIWVAEAGHGHALPSTQVPSQGQLWAHAVHGTRVEPPDQVISPQPHADRGLC